MLQQGQAELKPEMKTIATYIFIDWLISVATFLTHVATLIKQMAMKLMSRYLTTMSQHKELKIAEKLYRNKRQLCRDTKSTINFEGQEDSRDREILCRDKK